MCLSPVVLSGGGKTISLEPTILRLRTSAQFANQTKREIMFTEPTLGYRWRPGFLS